jgi:tetratricopeptide (TPR) repeat protein
LRVFSLFWAVIKKNKMKKIVVVISVLALGTASMAQPVKKAAPAAKSPHLDVFYQTLQSGDVSTAISSLNYYVAAQNGNTAYADTLAMLYMQQGAYAQCYHWANRRLALSPEDVTLMEMKAVCLDKLQQPTEAITLFEKLFKKTQSPFHAYKLMELQYGIKRLMECVNTATVAEKLTYKPEYIMPYVLGEQTGRTYLQAGVYNIHALALYDLDRKAEAKTYFEKALALDSNFALAKQNLQAMRAAEAAASKGVTNTPTQGAPPANKQD